MITTAAIDSMTFLGPVYVGERGRAPAPRSRTSGRTSVESRIEIFAEPLDRDRAAAGGGRLRACTSRSTNTAGPAPIPGLLSRDRGRPPPRRGRTAPARPSASHAATRRGRYPTWAMRGGDGSPMTDSRDRRRGAGYLVVSGTSLNRHSSSFFRHSASVPAFNLAPAGARSPCGARAPRWAARTWGRTSRRGRAAGGAGAGRRGAGRDVAGRRRRRTRPRSRAGPS